MRQDGDVTTYAGFVLEFSVSGGKYWTVKLSQAGVSRGEVLRICTGDQIEEEAKSWVDIIRARDYVKD